jgi:aminoglycoside 6-adenylyltransferase
MDTFLSNITVWAQNRQDIKALLLVGSRARTDRPADIWSDYDIIMIVDDPETYIQNSSWLNELGNVVLSFIEKCVIGDSFEHRVLFDNGQDVDFIIESAQAASSTSLSWCNPHVVDVYKRGYQVLFDNIGISSALEKLTSGAPLAYTPPPPESFTNVINDFFYHCVWTVKKLMRGELWTAKHCLNGYLQKNCLLKMIEWHARAQQPRNLDTWFSGRFMEKWTDKKIIARLHKLDACYDARHIIRALYEIIDLFNELAFKTAALLHHTYEHKKAEWIRKWIKKTVANIN